MDELITETDRTQKEYLDAITDIESSLFPKMNLKKILWNETIYCQQKVNMLKVWVATLLFETSLIEKKINNHDLLCIHTVFYRTDHDGYWEKIKNDAGIHDEINIYNKSKKIDFKHILIKIQWYMSAYKELNGICQKSHRQYLALQLTRRKWTLEEIKKMDLSPKAVMCFFDSSPDESVLMQYFKQQGAVTFTNQHGQSIFRSWDYDRLNQSQLLNFKCDYYLAKGSMQIQQFINAGFSKEHFISIGIIDNKETMLKQNDTNIFGVYLDGPEFEYLNKGNERMLEVAKVISKSINMKYFIKIHPVDNADRYSKYVGNNCIGIYDKSIKLEQTFEQIKFGIMHASSTYVDLYSYGVRCFQLQEDEFKISYIEDVFSNVDELCEKIDEWEKTSNNDKKEYINKVRRLYDSGWHKGLVGDVIRRHINCGE